jgi:hypothetical protein
MAIHDRYYATPPATYDALRWRLQHIAEEEVGKRVREAQASEDAVASRMAEVMNGPR